MSNANFEIKYIKTSWHDRQTLLKVEESQYELSLEEVSQDSFEALTTIYPYVEGLHRSQIAIACKDQRITKKPVIVSPDGTMISLKEVVNPDTGKMWWVEPGEWCPRKKEWCNNTHRTAGTIDFRIGRQSLALHISLSCASKDELNKYLIDFKSDMWELILDENSYVQADVKQGSAGSVDAKTLKAVDSILIAARNVLKQPKSELRETQTLKSRQAVKPVPRTFMEIVTKGNSRLLTSRGAKPNYNVPENGYVLYALKATHRIVSQLGRVSQSKTERLTNNLQKLDQRLDALKEYKDIDRNLVVEDYKKARAEQDINCINAQLSSRLADLNSCESSSCVEFYLRLGKENQYGAHFCQCKSYIDDEWRPYDNYQFSSIELSGKFRGLFQDYTDYKLQAAVRYRVVSHGKGVVLSIVNVSSIQVIGVPKWLNHKMERFKKMERTAILLKEHGWKKKLNAQELEEQNKERTSIKNRKGVYEQELRNVVHVRGFLEPKGKQLRDLIKSFSSLGVKSKSSFPNSMTFVQNPSYQSVHAGYRKLREQVGLTDEDILMSLERVDSIGLVNIPLLYERWCLLQLIKSLTIGFKFVAEDGWKRKLLKILESKNSTDVISFLNPESKREILLGYEPRLNNGKTPDFVLDMNFEAKNGTISHKRVVLDAKFYSESFLNTRGGLKSVLHELAVQKDYSEDEKNAVFVLHPVLNALKEAGGPISPQAWARVTYLGELGFLDWDKRMPPHHIGAVCLNPLISYQYGDELHRLLGMLMQYEAARPMSCDDVESYNFCIACGSSSLHLVDHKQRNTSKVWYQCEECELFTVYNHCYSCNHRLIKNGEYWTYHATMPLQPTNIKCPQCETQL
ncbi:hypothetical protein L1D26_23115 [Vibrio mediterranei]|uniref:nuclease domain-containing protein n=1 Tax=Vibrio mediterranei TaxID=689 RepID=UPI001EFE548D|nr:nuclease domain-containing protein [Vibrio mediterranei]MCG9665947.1 hypothetical protein [Vibrio mediterranei]